MLKELYLLWLRLAAPQDLHYINGADTLPPPLPPEQERAALDALVSRHASAPVREQGILAVVRAPSEGLDERTLEALATWREQHPDDLRNLMR